MIDKEHELSVAKQCELLKVNRSSVYYQPVPVPFEDLAVMRAIDEIHLRRPFLGSRRLVDELQARGFPVNRKRLLRLMRVMGISPIYPKPRTTKPGSGTGHRVYPYLLDGLVIDRPNQVWAADITYIPMARGFAYLVGIIDVYSRRLLAWRLSNSMDTRFCLEALSEALERFGPPEIMNTDQGSQGGFKWSSQHLCCGGARWASRGSRCLRFRLGREGSGRRIGRYGRRCGRRAGRSRRVRCSVSSGA